MSFPPSILERAADRKLGEPVRAFDGRPGLRRALLCTGLLCLVGLVLVPTALIAPAAGNNGLGAVALVLALAYVGVAARIVRTGRVITGPSALVERNRAVYLFKGGFVLDARDGQDGYPWDDLASVTVSGVRDAAQSPTRYVFAVATVDDREITLGPELPDVRDLGEQVAAAVTERVLPGHLERMRAGETVRMGPFTLDRGGVEKEGEKLSWADVVEAGVENGVVYVDTIGEARRLSAIAARTPNAIAFVQLCRTLAGDEGPFSTP